MSVHESGSNFVVDWLGHLISFRPLKDKAGEYENQSETWRDGHRPQDAETILEAARAELDRYLALRA